MNDQMQSEYRLSCHNRKTSKCNGSNKVSANFSLMEQYIGKKVGQGEAVLLVHQAIKRTRFLLSCYSSSIPGSCQSKLANHYTLHSSPRKRGQSTYKKVYQLTSSIQKIIISQFLWAWNLGQQTCELGSRSFCSQGSNETSSGQLHDCSL